MFEYAILGKVVTLDNVIEDGVVVVRGDKILYAGEKSEAKLPKDVIDTKGKIIAPGFVDIHCHVGNDFLDTDENDEEVLKKMIQNGTTGILYSLFGSISHEKTLELITLIKNRMEAYKTVLGVHMEGPYLNPLHGSGLFDRPLPSANKKEHDEIIKTNMVKMWTFAPEVPGTDEFLKDIKAAGIVPAIGHTAISAKEVMEIAKEGVEVITHMFCATGDIPAPKYADTKAVSFDHGAMLCDNLFYEIICDKEGCHVPHELIKLLIKTVGIDRVIGITDFVCWEEAGKDVSFVYYKGEERLNGSAMSMLSVARNFSTLGLSLNEVFRVTSYNPSRAIKVDNKMGSLQAGKLANIIITDESFNECKTIVMGKQF